MAPASLTPTGEFHARQRQRNRESAAILLARSDPHLGVIESLKANMGEVTIYLQEMFLEWMAARPRSVDELSEVQLLLAMLNASAKTFQGLEASALERADRHPALIPQVDPLHDGAASAVQVSGRFGVGRPPG